ncbi:MAG: hypothetical protein Q8876_02685 [Bacillota bacterium]|nr:hypothetical protein [Bacillota bacterium]
MKQCEYCAKEISYHEQYCNEECKDNALDFFDKIESKNIIFSVFQIAGIILMIIGFITGVFQAFWGTLISGCAAILLGIVFYILPFGTLEMIKKFKIKKMIKITKLIALGFILFGLIDIALGQFVF